MVTARPILGEVGDIHRFPNSRKLVTYAGLDATIRQSGQFSANLNCPYDLCRMDAESSIRSRPSMAAGVSEGYVETL